MNLAGKFSWRRLVGFCRSGWLAFAKLAGKFPQSQLVHPIRIGWRQSPERFRLAYSAELRAHLVSRGFAARKTGDAMGAQAAPSRYEKSDEARRGLGT